MLDSQKRLVVLEVDVDPEWIDGNGHVSDRYYTSVFSDAEVAFLEQIGAGKSYRQVHGGHIYTAENHLTFIAEILPGDRMTIAVGLVDHSDKALHLSFEMYNRASHLCAHHETLLLHVRKDPRGKPKVGPFDANILHELQDFKERYGAIESNPYCSKAISIRR